LWGLREAGVPAGDAVVRQGVEYLLVNQRADGSWSPGGQLPTQKRAKVETGEVSTMWMTMALGGLSEEEQALVGTAGAAKRAEGFLAKAKGGTSAEWAVMRLVRAARAGASETKVKRLADILKKWQRADGGWNWVGVPTEEASDALATGMALWGLREAGVPAGDAVVRQGVEYLLVNQRADGSWEVKSTKAAKREEALHTSVYWGTAWGVIGLLGCLE
jgi:hypothetical protein